MERVRKAGYIGIPWAVLFQAQKDKAEVWREFVGTDAGKRWLDRKNIDSVVTAYDLGSYFWGK